ncbi:MAG: M20/M25/M40 family metallo-hydrolase [Chloroflexota bacterium]|nr:M20/M25/M40 family metallo-hydrolase [Chloroflexota bacterium]
MDWQAVFEAVEAKRELIVKTLCDVIHIDTSVPPGHNYDKMADYLEPIFQRLGFETERVVVPPEKLAQIPLPLEGERVNLVARKRFGKEPCSIYAHMDVVPVEEPWTIDPFAGVVKEGKVYGRGAIDMKGSIASLIGALAVIEELSLTPHYDLICLMCTDEEIGTYPGVYHLALEGYVEGHVLCLEGGAQAPFLVGGMAGDVTVTVTTIGKSCHSGMNFLGVNAIDEMVPILNELLALKRRVEQRKSSVPLFPIPGAPSEWMSPMFNLVIIQGGVKDNIIPSRCTVTIDRRYIPEEDYEDVVAEIREAVERGRRQSKALDVQVAVQWIYGAFKADPESPHMHRMWEAKKAVHGYRDEDLLVAGVAGSSDMGMVVPLLGDGKFAGTGPFRPDNTTAHRPDEFACVDDLVSMAKELIYYLAG